jgi:hypothetical protein
VGDADQLRERAARLFALAINLRESRGSSVTANDIEQLAHESLAQAEAIERESNSGGENG